MGDGLIRRGKIYHIDIVIKGNRIRQSTGTEDRELALNILAKIRTEAIERRYYPKPIGGDGSISTLVQGWIPCGKTMNGSVT